VGVDQHQGSTRYRLLETVRAVATAYSDTAGDAATARRNLGERYLSDLPIDKRGNREWRMRLTLENATIVQLVNRLVLDGELELAYALARISVEDVRGRASTRDPTAFLLRLVDEQHQPANGSARLHIAAAKLLADSGDVIAAAEHIGAAHDLRERFGDHDRLGFVRLTNARSQLSLRDGSEAALLAAERELNEELDGGLPLSNRSDALLELSMVAQALNHDDPKQYLREAADIAEQLDDHFLHMTVLNNLAEQELRDGDTPSAARHQREAMRLAAELGIQLVTAFGLVLAARIAQSESLDVAAVRIHAAADLLLEECGFEMIPDDQVLSDAALDAARKNLGDAAFDEAVAAGRRASLSDALAEAEAVFDRAMNSVATAD
jgi:tetratricopeptide (TPR) repeat protein